MTFHTSQNINRWLGTLTKIDATTSVFNILGSTHLLHQLTMFKRNAQLIMSCTRGVIELPEAWAIHRTYQYTKANSYIRTGVQTFSIVTLQWYGSPAVFQVIL